MEISDLGVKQVIKNNNIQINNLSNLKKVQETVNKCQVENDKKSKNVLWKRRGEIVRNRSSYIKNTIDLKFSEIRFSHEKIIKMISNTLCINYKSARLRKNSISKIEVIPSTEMHPRPTWNKKKTINTQIDKKRSICIYLISYMNNETFYVLET